MKNENGLSELGFSSKVNSFLLGSLIHVADYIEEANPGIRKLFFVSLALALVECRDKNPDLPEKDRCDIDYILRSSTNVF